MRSFMIFTSHQTLIGGGGQIKKNAMGGACSMYGDRAGAYRVLVGRSDGK